MYAGFPGSLAPYVHVGNQILHRSNGLPQEANGYPSIYLFSFI
jgi:hypothetical protein